MHGNRQSQTPGPELGRKPKEQMVQGHVFDLSWCVAEAGKCHESDSSEASDASEPEALNRLRPRHHHRLGSQDRLDVLPGPWLTLTLI